MTDILMGIRSIKCLSWEKIFNNKLMQIRVREYKYYKYARLIDIFSAVIW